MKKILIVDDQRGIRLLLKEVLKQERYDTFLAANGIEALRILDDGQMDCVLLDMKIPGMNGLEILSEIKKKNSAIPVFMMTAYGEQDIIQEAMTLGATDYFTKPFNIFDVLKEIKRVLGE